jgi:hypothetical protein
MAETLKLEEDRLEIKPIELVRFYTFTRVAFLQTQYQKSLELSRKFSLSLRLRELFILNALVSALELNLK